MNVVDAALVLDGSIQPADGDMRDGLVIDVGSPERLDMGSVEEERPPNILLLIADDLGIDAAGCYRVGQNVAQTPNIQSLCERGVVFRNAWVNPVCSATRATLLTGRYAFRTGVGRTAPPGLQRDELTLPRALDLYGGGTYAHASVGKWHLLESRNSTNNDHPNEMGWGHFAGLLTGVLPDYFDFTKVVDGQAVRVQQYATTDTVDDAISWLGVQERPWFLWVAFNAPHSPYHEPPPDLYHIEGLGEDERTIQDNPLPYYKAAIEAMDTEIGRLFAAIGPEEMERTHVIYLGDNGTPGRVIQAPFEQGKGKGTIYSGGIHVPLVVAGPAVREPGRTQEALVNGVDLFGTILELAGVDVDGAVRSDITIDSVSLVPYLVDSTTVPRREWILSELFNPRANDPDGKTIRDARFKLIRFRSGSEALFDLSTDLAEENDLLLAPLTDEGQAAYQRLGQQLDAVLATE